MHITEARVCNYLHGLSPTAQEFSTYTKLADRTCSLFVFELPRVPPRCFRIRQPPRSTKAHGDYNHAKPSHHHLAWFCLREDRQNVPTTRVAGYTSSLKVLSGRTIPHTNSSDRTCKDGTAGLLPRTRPFQGTASTLLSEVIFSVPAYLVSLLLGFCLFLSVGASSFSRPISVTQ